MSADGGRSGQGGTTALLARCGRSRALSVAGGNARKPWLPEAPTAVELGMPAFDGTGWSGFLVPAGTPPKPSSD